MAGRQSRRNAEDASGACCPGGVGMVVGKGQQALARRNHTKRDLFSGHTTDGERKQGQERRSAWSEKVPDPQTIPSFPQHTMVYS